MGLWGGMIKQWPPIRVNDSEVEHLLINRTGFVV